MASVPSVPSLTVKSLLTLADAQNLSLDDCLFFEAEVNQLVTKKVNNHFKSEFLSREGAEQFTELICKSWFLFGKSGLLKVRHKLTVQIDFHNESKDTYCIEENSSVIQVYHYTSKGLNAIWRSGEKLLAVHKALAIDPIIIEYAKFLFPDHNKASLA